MPKLRTPPTRTRADGTIVHVADYFDQDGGRHQIGHDDARAARLAAERNDVRMRADISLARYLLRYADNLPEHLKPNTRGLYADRLERCATYAPDVQLSKCDASHIVELERSMLKAGLSSDTAARYIGLIEPALERARGEGRVRINAVRRYFSVPGRAVAAFQHTLAPPDHGQIARIATLLSPHNVPGLLLATGAGLSAREAICLQRCDINEAQGSIAVRRTMHGPRIAPPDNPASTRVIFGVDRNVIDAALMAPRVPEGGDWVIQATGRYGPMVRTTLYFRLLKELKQVQSEAGIISLETERPFAHDDFRDRWVVDQLRVDGILVVMAMAGYASFPHFAARYRAAFLDPQSHEQMELAMTGFEALSSLQGNDR